MDCCLLRTSIGLAIIKMNIAQYESLNTEYKVYVNTRFVL